MQTHRHTEVGSRADTARQWHYVHYCRRRSNALMIDCVDIALIDSEDTQCDQSTSTSATHTHAHAQAHSIVWSS